MTLEDARNYAKTVANHTGSSVLVFKSLLAEAKGVEDFGVAFTLPMWGKRVEDRIYPNSEQEPLNA